MNLILNNSSVFARQFFFPCIMLTFFNVASQKIIKCVYLFNSADARLIAPLLVPYTRLISCMYVHTHVFPCPVFHWMFASM